MQKSVLYPRQEQILHFIEQYMLKNESAPSLTTIRNFLGIRTLSTIHEHIAKLETKGFIQKVHTKEGIKYSVTHSNDSNTHTLPLKGTIAAGSPILAIEDTETQISIPSSLIPRTLNPIYALKVKGDSMKDAFIADKDIVIIEKTQIVHNGDTIVALLDDNTVTLKKFFKEAAVIRLKPANENYSDILVKDLTIQGKVIAVYRKY